MPQVSIITALHNKGPYVAETIRSVAVQTMQDWELIVVENGSADDGPEVVRQFRDPRIRLVISPKQGPGAARSFGLGLATGEWILFLDADDLLAPDYLEERLGLLKNHPGADLLVGCWEEFKDGSPEHRTFRQPAARGGTAQDIANAAIAYAPWVLHAALVRKSRLIPERSWPDELDSLPHEDAAFWFPVVCGASVAWSENAGAVYRVATVGSRNEIVDAERTIQGVIAVIEYNLKYARTSKFGPNNKQMATVVRVIESNYRLALKKGNRAAAALALRHGESLLVQSPTTGTSMRIRQLLGMRLFNLLRFGAI